MSDIRKIKKWRRLHFWFVHRGEDWKQESGWGIDKKMCMFSSPTYPHYVELEALGDDFLGEEEDSSYLDVPDPPTGIPDDKGREQVR